MDIQHESLFLGVQTKCKFIEAGGLGSCRNGPGGCRCGEYVREEDDGYPPLGDHTFEWLDMMAGLEQRAE